MLSIRCLAISWVLAAVGCGDHPTPADNLGPVVPAAGGAPAEREGLRFAGGGPPPAGGAQEIKPLARLQVSSWRDQEWTLSADGTLLACVSPELSKERKLVYELTVWDIKTGRPKWRSRVPDGQLHRPVFSPDGRLVAVGGFKPRGWPPRQARVVVWDVATGATKYTLLDETDNNSFFGVLAFAPGGGELAAGWDVDGTVHRWDAATGEPLKSIATDEWRIMSLAYSHGGKLLATTEFGTGGRVKCWEVATGKLWMTVEPEALVPGVFFFTPDDKFLSVTVATVNAKEGRVWQWAVGPGKKKAEGKIELLRHRETFASAAANSAAFPGHGDILAIGTEGGKVILWDLVKQREVGVIAVHRSDIQAPLVAHILPGHDEGKASTFRSPVRVFGGREAGEALFFVAQDGKELLVWRVPLKDVVRK